MITRPGGGMDHGAEKPAVLLRSIAFAANERYFPGLYCAVASMLAHAKAAQLRVYVLDGGLSGDSLQRLDGLVKSYHGGAEICQVALTLDRFEGFPLGPEQSLMTYARLALPELLPDENCILYLDADLLVFADVGRLCAHTLPAGVLVAAVRDAEILTTAQDAPRVAALLGQSANDRYFNAGVMLMDLAAMRACGFTSQVLDFLACHGDRCRFYDQSAINFVFGERIAELPRMWNTPAWMFEQERWGEQPPECLLHFTNEAPWLKDSGGASNALFRRYAAATGVPVNEDTDEFRASRTLARRREAEAPWRAAAYAATAMICMLPGLGKGRAGYAAAAGHWWRRFSGRRARRALHAANLATLEQWFRQGLVRTARKGDEDPAP
ncbi:MAG: glycosyltransferase family 8 protein [Akkermansiaceae bacterium]|nr:glycosyltransferase family 8 protein [Akkermansiaceae bacterium]